LNITQIAFLMFGIIVARVLLINRDFASKSNGYILKSVINKWHIVLLAVFVNLLFAVAYSGLYQKIIDPKNSVIFYSCAIICGIASVVSPNGISRIINYIWLKKISNIYLSGKLPYPNDLKFLEYESLLNINIHLQIEIDLVKQIDKMHFLSQTKWWNLKLHRDHDKNKELAHNRLRLLFDQWSRDESDSGRIKDFNILAIDHNLSQKFQYLVDFYGRKKLKNLLRQKPFKIRLKSNWKGKDRRKIIEWDKSL